MALSDVFNFPYHDIRTTLPDNSVRVRYGKGYSFAARPADPPQRLFTLTFEGLKYELNTSTGLFDSTINPTNNALALEYFYRKVELWDVFTYNHQLYGALAVRFNKPLDFPRPQKGGTGYITQMTVEFIEVPN